MRTSIRRPALVASTLVAALSLTLTACGGGDGAKDQGAAVPASSSAAARGGDTGTAGGDTAGTGTSGAATAGSGTSGPSTSGSSASGSGTSGSSDSADPATQAGAKKNPGGKAPACTVDDLKISAAKQEGVPTTHITLTATNVSGRACTLLRYPLIAFGDIQTAKDVPSVAKSRPATPVVLNAGAPAYAAVRVNEGGVDENNRVVTSFHVNLFAADGPAEGSKVVSAPKGGLAVDDAVARTGFWTPELRNGADEF
ncbi:DUF4232 domain-containing protein [Streptomyces lateritius]|uniref:DUF4232 domain-containing protein n=1 Tax=Streptomyces lateritius TaxID=67313 RepID=UPI001678E40E|nr:DUF4232 domain-containing protein [Streptomyces lateritius]GGT73130.1 hypothetical protein GCM10010272_15560 [Streptomyces lateritius]